MKLSLLTPIGYNHSPYYWLSLIKFIEYCKEKDIEIEHIHNRVSNIYMAREELLNKATGNYILWIDSDASFTPKHFEQLLAHNKEFVACVAKYYDPRVKSLKWNFGWYMPQAYEPLGIWMRNPLCNEDIGKDLIEVDYTGLHFALMKRCVNDGMAFPKFEALHCNLIHPSIKGYMSEDGAFCFFFKQMGIKIWVDPTCHVGHDKNFII